MKLHVHCTMSIIGHISTNQFFKLIKFIYTKQVQFNKFNTRLLPGQLNSSHEGIWKQKQLLVIRNESSSEFVRTKLTASQVNIKSKHFKLRKKEFTIEFMIFSVVSFASTYTDPLSGIVNLLALPLTLFLSLFLPVFEILEANEKKFPIE